MLLFLLSSLLCPPFPPCPTVPSCPSDKSKAARPGHLCVVPRIIRAHESHLCFVRAKWYHPPSRGRQGTVGLGNSAQPRGCLPWNEPHRERQERGRGSRGGIERGENFRKFATRSCSRVARHYEGAGSQSGGRNGERRTWRKRQGETGRDRERARAKGNKGASARHFSLDRGAATV